MIKLHLFSGFENKKLGITKDTKLGHLYSDTQDKDELIKAGTLVGTSTDWLQTPELTGLLHFDLWGTPLRKARRLFPIVSDEQLVYDMERIKANGDTPKMD
jgi:hypothetical protein